MSSHGTASAGERSVTGRERWDGVASAVAGGALLALGLRRRSVAGTVAAFAGGWLLYRGLGGRGSLREALGATPVADGEPTSPETATAAVNRSHTVTIGASPEELHERWRDPETQTRVFGKFADVTSVEDDRWRWEVDGPFGRRMTWETRIVEDRPGELIRWESPEGTAVSASGSIRFRPAPGDRGTEATLQISFDPPGGAVVDAAADALGIVPETLAAKALRRFKSLVEAGEIPTLEKNPSGRGRGDLV